VERRSDRPALSLHHHRFLYAHERRETALLCRRLRKGADGQKLGAAPAYASLARACGVLGCGGCGGRASVLGIASAFVFRRRVMWIGPSRATPPTSSGILVVDDRPYLWNRAEPRIPEPEKSAFCMLLKPHSGLSKCRNVGFSLTGQSPDLLVVPPSTPISRVGPAPHSWRGSFP